jgi:ArsR family transcriptional regulator, zinc-responsive transcriptional repressor
MIRGPAPAPAQDGASDLDSACELLRALGAPHRLAIVLELSEGTRCVHELVDSLGISQSLASQHLRVLRAAGLVTSMRRGKETAYSLTGRQASRIARDALAHHSPPSRRVRQHGQQPAPGDSETAVMTAAAARRGHVGGRDEGGAR